MGYFVFELELILKHIVTYVAVVVEDNIDASGGLCVGVDF
jgi:hypothetical protein